MAKVDRKERLQKINMGGKSLFMSSIKLLWRGMGIAQSNFCLVEPFGSVTVQAYAVVVDAHTSLSFRADMFLLEMKWVNKGDGRREGALFNRGCTCTPLRKSSSLKVFLGDWLGDCVYMCVNAWGFLVCLMFFTFHIFKDVNSSSQFRRNNRDLWREQRSGGF